MKIVEVLLGITIKKIIEKAKMECPPEIHVCFEDKALLNILNIKVEKLKKIIFFILRRIIYFRLWKNSF